MSLVNTLAHSYKQYQDLRDHNTQNIVKNQYTQYIESYIKDVLVPAINEVLTQNKRPVVALRHYNNSSSNIDNETQTFTFNVQVWFPALNRGAFDLEFTCNVITSQICSTLYIITSPPPTNNRTKGYSIDSKFTETSEVLESIFSRLIADSDFFNTMLI